METTHRTLHDHIINPENEKLTITVFDEPGAGGANHCYGIDGIDYSKNPASYLWDDQPLTVLIFQDGPIPEVGVNGLTNEALLAIVADRLHSFQEGPYSCKENACALTHIEEAMHWLQQRTIARMRRGVEGTHTV